MTKNLEEQKFILINHWLRAGPCQAKRDAEAELKERFPDVRPWDWNNGYAVPRVK